MYSENQLSAQMSAAKCRVGLSMALDVLALIEVVMGKSVDAVVSEEVQAAIALNNTPIKRKLLVRNCRRIGLLV
jgi:hypothetical protein